MENPVLKEEFIEFAGHKWKKRWVCSGWTGTGSIKSGTGTHTSAILDEDSTITWNWTQDSLLSGQVTSIIAFIAVFAVAVVGYYWLVEPFIVAVAAGAIGGLAHEIVQSGGKYILPNCDERGNFVLGGLVGIVTGGVAGLLLFEGLLGASVAANPELVVGAFLAGLAVKGIADAPNPK